MIFTLLHGYPYSIPCMPHNRQIVWRSRVQRWRPLRFIATLVDGIGEGVAEIVGAGLQTRLQFYLLIQCWMIYDRTFSSAGKLAAKRYPKGEIEQRSYISRNSFQKSGPLKKLFIPGYYLPGCIYKISHLRLVGALCYYYTYGMDAGYVLL